LKEIIFSKEKDEKSIEYVMRKSERKKKHKDSFHNLKRA